MENNLKMGLTNTINKNEQNTSKISNVSNNNLQGQNLENKGNTTRGSIDSSKKLVQNTKPRYTNSYMQAHVKKQIYQEEKEIAAKKILDNSNLSNKSLGNKSVGNKSIGASSSTSKILKGNSSYSKMTASAKNLKSNALLKSDPRRSVSTNQPIKKFIRKLSVSNPGPLSERVDTQESQASNILDTSKLKDDLNLHLMNVNDPHDPHEAHEESVTISLSPVTKGRGMMNFDEFKTNGELEDLVNFKKLVDSKIDENKTNQKLVNNNTNQGPIEILKTSDGFKNNTGIVNTNSNNNSNGTTPKKKNSYSSAIAAIAKAEKNLKTNLTGINSNSNIKTNSSKNINLGNNISNINNSSTNSGNQIKVNSNQSTTTVTSKASINISPPKRSSSLLTSNTGNTIELNNNDILSKNQQSSLGTTVAKNNLKPKGTIIQTASSISKSNINLENIDSLNKLQSPLISSAEISNDKNSNTISNNTLTNTMASTIKLTSPRNDEPTSTVNFASPTNITSTSQNSQNLNNKNLLLSSVTNLRDPEKEKNNYTPISPSRNNKEEFVIEMNEPKDSITINETDNFIFNTSPQVHMTGENFNNLNKNTQEDWNININNSNSNTNSPPRKKNSMELVGGEAKKIIDEVPETEDQEVVEVEEMHLTTENRQDLSQIDEVLSNISHNLTSRDMYIHRDSIPKIVNYISSSANCFSINPNNKDRERDYLNITIKEKSHLHNYSVNIENSILIPGTHTEIISEPLELNHSVKFSIDPAYTKGRYHFNQSLFDESKMEISIPIIIRKKSPYKRVKEADVEIGAKHVVVSPLEISRMDICLEAEKSEKNEKTEKSRNDRKDHRLMRTSKSQENNKARDMYLISTHKRHAQKGKGKNKTENSSRGRTDKSNANTNSSNLEKMSVYTSPSKQQFKNNKTALLTINKIQNNPSFSISEQKKKDFPIATHLLSKRIERQENLELTILPVPKKKSKSPEKKIIKNKELEIKAISIPVLSLKHNKEEKIEHQQVEIIGLPQQLGIKPANSPNDQVIDHANFDKSLISMLNKLKQNIEKNKEKSSEIFNINSDIVEFNRKNLDKQLSPSPWSTNQNFNPNPSRNIIQEKLEKLSSNKSVKSKSASRSPSKEKFSSINNKISKNKIEVLKENLDNSYRDNESPNSQERKFRQKVDSVKNRLNLGNDDKFKYNYQTLFPKSNTDTRVNINTLNSLGQSNYPRREASPEEDFSDIILPDEIISELQEKYFGKMEFIDRRKLVKFYKKYIKKENNKSNKLNSLDTLDSRKIGSGFLVKQDERDDQKNIKKLREMLNLKDENVSSGNYSNYSNNRENYFSVQKPNRANINTNINSDVMRSVCDVNQARKKYLINSSSRESMGSFGIMPTNAIDHNNIKLKSNLANFN